MNGHTESNKALVAMSGGVDSAVAAMEVLRLGYDAVGVTMCLRPEADACGSAAEVADARAVAEKLGIDHRVYDFREAFAAEVIKPFVCAYEQGETPNPCIECNRHMKFDRLYEVGRELGCNTVATGHYARISFDEKTGRYQLKKARDPAKDQTYVLYFLTQEQLAHTVFPLGEFDSKAAVRQMAEERGFGNARKHDSQDICFVESGKYGEFIRQYTGHDYPPGEFVDASGKMLGQHRGLIHYTIGQRRGLGLSLPAPLYVCRKDTAANRVVLCPDEGLYADRLTAVDFHWISGDIPTGAIRASARTRYSAKEAPATVTPLPGDRAEICFDAPQRAITPGQAVVLYDGDTVLGGGKITDLLKKV